MVASKKWIFWIQLESWIEAGTKSPQFSLGHSSITKLSMQSSRSSLRLTSAKSPISPLLPSGQERFFQILGQRIFFKLLIFGQNNLRMAKNMLPSEIFSYRYQRSKWRPRFFSLPELINRLTFIDQNWNSCWK